MAKREKKVSIRTMDEVAGERFINETTEQWYGTDIHIRRSLPFTEALSFVDEVVSSCFQTNYGFMPELIDFAIKRNILKRYTNISLPEKLEHSYKIIYTTDIIDFVCKHINMKQVDELVVAIDRKVAHMCNAHVAEARRQTDEIVSGFNQIYEKISGLFDGVTRDDMTKLLGAIENGSVSEDKIVKSYLEQTGSDNTSGTDGDG